MLATNSLGTITGETLSFTTPAASTVTLASNPNPSTYGSSVTLTATVSTNTATGTVTFMEGTQTLGSGILTGGVASFTLSNLAVGNHSITAVYTGDGNYGASTSSALTQVISQAMPSVTVHTTLSGLTLSSGTLSPAFATGTTSYTASVPYATASITITPVVTDATTTIQVNEVATTSGSASAAIPLAVGPNTHTTVVTAQDGTTQSTYTVIVDRRAPPSTLLQGGTADNPGGGKILTFAAFPNSVYQVETSSDLEVWSPLGSFPAGTDGCLVITAPGATAASRFYRFKEIRGRRNHHTNWPGKIGKIIIVMPGRE